MNLLIVNAGSSSLKLSVINADSGERLLKTSTECNSTAQSAEDIFRQSLSEIASRASEFDLQGVVHRVVHGGTRFTQATKVTTKTLNALEQLCDLAPLHNPASLRGIQVAMEYFNDLSHVVVFDTSFHATLIPEAQSYPVPYQWTEEWGLRKFGFHGMSHAYCAQRAVEMLGKGPEGLRLIIAHLGNGCSVCAVKGGQSIDTSMGFTPLEGLMMGTRSGSIDPGLILHVMRERGLSVTEMEQVLNHESGLLGVSGVSSDIREVLQAASTGNERAKLAISQFAHRARQAIGALAVTFRRSRCVDFHRRYWRTSTRDSSEDLYRINLFRIEHRSNKKCRRGKG